MPKKLTYNATITERRDVTETLATFRLQPAPTFLPGQYVTVGLPAEDSEDAEWVQRPFSISSAPEDPAGIELYLRCVERPVSATPLSHLLFARRAGDPIYVRPSATGRFTLEHTIGEGSPAIKLFVAGGTGVAPFVSMIRSRALRTNSPLADYVLLHGVRTPDELAFHEELLRLSVVRGLRYLPSISRPQLAPDWEGLIGRVNELLRPERIEQTESMLGLPIRPEHTIVFVCGLHDLIAATIDHLLPRGYAPAHRRIRTVHGIPDSAPTTLFYEQYDDAPLVQRKTAERAEV